MNKLSYRDRVIILVLTVVVIVVAIFFLGVNPIRKDIKTNAKKLEEKQAEWAEIEKEINRIPSLENDIEESYEVSVKLAQEFTELRDTYEVDKFLQPLLDQNGLKIESDLSIDEPNIVNLEYYYVTPDILTYPLAEAADLDGSLAEDIAEKMNETFILSNKTIESVVGTTVNISFKAQKENILSFIEAVKALDDAIIITNVTVDDYQFNPFADEPEEVGYSTGTVTIMFYSVQEVQEPNF